MDYVYVMFLCIVLCSYMNVHMLSTYENKCWYIFMPVYVCIFEPCSETTVFIHVYCEVSV